MRVFFVVCAAAFVWLVAPMAQAQAARLGARSPDMFYDRNWVYDRPRVPSDAARGQDMFRAVPPMFHADADLFDGVKPRFYGRADLFPALRTVAVAPSRTLKMDPRNGVIEQALYLYRP